MRGLALPFALQATRRPLSLDRGSSPHAGRPQPTVASPAGRAGVPRPGLELRGRRAPAPNGRSSPPHGPAQSASCRSQSRPPHGGADRESLRFWMRELALPARVEFAPFDQVFQQLLDPHRPAVAQPLRHQRAPGAARGLDRAPAVAGRPDGCRSSSTRSSARLSAPQRPAWWASARLRGRSWTRRRCEPGARLEQWQAHLAERSSRLAGLTSCGWRELTATRYPSGILRRCPRRARRPRALYARGSSPRSEPC